MSVTIANMFSDDGEVPKAPRRGSSGGRVSLVERKNRNGRVQILKARDGLPATLEEFMEACGDATTNASGTSAGAGIGGRGGAGYYKDSDGSIPPTYENVRLSVQAMQPVVLHKLLAELELTPEEFAAWVRSLPRQLS